MKNFLIVDDHAMTRVGVITTVTAHLRVKIREADNMQQALQWLDAEKFDLVLLDINIPDGHSSHMVGQLRERQKDVKILVFSGHDERIYALKFLEKGANGYLSKACTTEQFLQALDVVQNSRIYVSAQIEEMIIRDLLNTKGTKLKPDKLSRREKEIAQLLMQGHGVSTIGNILNLKSSTVSTIKRSIFEKLQITSVVDLVKRGDLAFFGM
jgi:two-component system invasion response regulator UvrY